MFYNLGIWLKNALGRFFGNSVNLSCFVLFVWILYILVNIFSVMSRQFPQVSCVEGVPLVSNAQGHNTVSK